MPGQKAGPLFSSGSHSERSAYSAAAGQRLLGGWGSPRKMPAGVSAIPALRLGGSTHPLCFFFRLLARPSPTPANATLAHA